MTLLFDAEHRVPHLGDLEARVMDVVWGAPAQTVREIIERLGDEHAYTTMATVLRNLERKGFVTVEREPTTTRYRAAQTRCERAAELMALAMRHSRQQENCARQFADAVDDDEARMLFTALQRRLGLD